jgi:hypothetical protein
MADFDAIILLTGQAEQPILSATLLGYNPLLRLFAISTLAELLALDPAMFSQARLIAFASSVIVPARILERLGFAAYNFHPGSPQFPGWAPAFLACHLRAADFGATVHRMIERVDAGPIVGVESFAVPDGITPAGLEGLAYAHLARLFWRFAPRLATETSPLPKLPVEWSGERASRRLFRSIFDLHDGISDRELIAVMRRRIR